MLHFFRVSVSIRRLAVLFTALFFIAAPASTAALANSVLSTWADSKTRSKIIDFVTKVTTPGGPGFVPLEERIATFDMDGTVITEKPASVQKIIA
ncbi:MAG: haloacid dehalogenase-like hydrolase, partial [Alphaproteobacteria bacterium]|nr:haloacid dehalogenase-like hydrolase [Alphaproteobacteria bacterium]